VSATKSPLPAYRGEEPFIFITFAHQDSQEVLPEIRWLQDCGFNVWWDEGISPGAAWRAEVAEAIQRCSLLLFFVTPSSVLSDHCTREVTFALDDHRRPVLAVHLEPTTLPGALALSLSDRQAIFRYALGPEDYERKLVSAIATYLDEPIPLAAATSRHRRPRLRTAAWTYGALGVVLGALAVWSANLLTQRSAPDGVDRAISKFRIDLPSGVYLDTLSSPTSPLAVSRDGRLIVFRGKARDGSRLYVRSLGELESRPISGTDAGGASFALSTDGTSVLFYDFAQQGLVRTPVGGGPTTTVTNARAFAGTTWGSDGVVIFSKDQFGSALFRTSDTGAELEPLTDPMNGEFHSHPYLRNDMDVLLYTQVRRVPFRSEIVARSLKTGTDVVLTDGSAPIATVSGHLLFSRAEAIWAAPFDPERMALDGDPVPVLDDVAFTGMGAPIFAVADDGSLVYQPRDTQRLIAQSLVWLSANGTRTRLPVEANIIMEPRLSPTGNELAMRLGERNVLWLYSLERETFTKLTDDTVFSLAWHPDGKRIAYTPVRNDYNLFWRKADGTGSEARLTRSTRSQWASHWSSDGRTLLYTECDGAYGVSCDVGQVTLDAEPVSQLVLATKANEQHPALSPDDRWLAYESDESGRFEVYVRPYPDVDARRWQVSNEGGSQPIWSPDGRTIYYASGPPLKRRMMSVDVGTGGTLYPQTPEFLFEFQNAGYYALRNHDIRPDGDGFLIATPDTERQGNQYLVYVLNWLDELERLVPTR